MSIIALFVLYGWIPFVLLLFAVSPPRQALIVSYVAGWLILPPLVFTVPGLPDFGKYTVISYGVLLAILIFDIGRLRSLRPSWVDLAFVGFLVSPFFSSLTNDLGVYNGLSAVMNRFFIWGVPYLSGRLYLSPLPKAREFAIAIFLGGLFYVVPCLIEIRLSPQLKNWVYGIFGWEFLRYGGYRPMVFLATGLELGMWMTAASFVGYTLWISRSLTTIRSFSMGTFLSVLVVTTVLCKSTGALMLLAAGVGTVWLVRRFGYSLPLWILLLTAPMVVGVRTSRLWSGREFVDFVAKYINEERAESFEFRLYHEDLILDKLQQRLFFGWGGFGRERVTDESGRDLSITDSLWILEISTNGVFGVTGWLLLMTLPGVLLLRRVPGHQWFGPDVAPVAALSLMGNLYALDCLSNAMINPIYFVAVGAVTSCVGALPRRGRPGQPTLSKTPSPDDPRVEEAQAHADQAARLEAAGSYDEAEYEHRVAMGLWENLLAETPSDLVFKLELARSYEGFARNLAARGRFSDAETLWNRVVELLDALLIEAPDDVHAAHRAAEARNDLAWMLASLPETTGDVATRAVQWAEAAIRLAPDHPACWNTLATAYYRAGAGQATLEVLERATRLGYRHPGYDDLLMAMAYCRLGEFSLARQWFHRGAVWANSQERSHLPDLQRLHDEAAELLKQSSEPQIALVPPRTH